MFLLICERFEVEHYSSQLGGEFGTVPFHCYFPGNCVQILIDVALDWLVDLPHHSCEKTM
jgi:hypothetical protein